MVGILKKATRVRWDTITDSIWPWPYGKFKEPYAKTFQADGSNDTISAAYNTLLPRQQQVEERNSAVERKLASLLPVTSALVSILAITLAAITARQTEFKPTSLEWQLAILGVATYVAVPYIILQLTCCILATVKGLRRRQFERSKPEDLMPLENEDEIHYKRRQINSLLKQISFNEEIVNDRVTWLEVAHRCLVNAAVMTIVLTTSALPTMIHQVKALLNIL